jgi:hypothetical protein
LSVEGSAELNLEELNLETAPGGVCGAPAPAVVEPNPNFCNVGASSLPVGFNPREVWNFFTDATVESSHFPLGVPANDPFFASAF